MLNKETENDGPSKSLGWWRIIWTVVRNILYLVVVLTVFEKMQSTFEIIVVSLLILIFESISWAHSSSKDRRRGDDCPTSDFVHHSPEAG